MPTTEKTTPQQAGNTDAPLAEGDVEALLSQADALMNDLQSSWEEQDKGQAAASTEDIIHSMAAEISNSAENADANAIISLLNQEESAEQGTGTTAEKETATPSTNSQSLPNEWLDPSLSDDDIPSIPDDSTSMPQDEDVSKAAEAPSLNPAKTRLSLVRTLYGILLRSLRSPLDILVLLDRPFAKMAPNTKFAIGYAAIGTLVVAISTWIYGSMQLAS